MKKVSGIYFILNLLNGKLYVGSAANIYSRIDWHCRALLKGKHHSILLQRAVDKYGIDNFEFIIVEETTDLLQIEQLWLDASKSYDPEFGYNIFKIAGSPKGYKHTEEWKLNNSRINKGRKLSEETIARMSNSQTNRSDEHRANHSAAMKKRIFSETHRWRLTLANLRRKPVSDETRQRMSIGQKKRILRQGYVVKP